MVTAAACTKIILALPDVTSAPHFDRTAFKTNKRIFATLAADGQSLNVKLTKVDQSVFCAFDDTVIFPVPNKWGLQGWTTVNLQKVLPSTFRDVLDVAYTTMKNYKPGKL